MTLVTEVKLKFQRGGMALAGGRGEVMLEATENRRNQPLRHFDPQTTMTNCSLKRSSRFFSVVFSALAFFVAGASTAQQVPPKTAESVPAQSKSQPGAAAPVPSAAPATTGTSPTESNPAGNAERSKSIVEHLNAVLRFYHDAASPTIQKVGEPSDTIYRDQTATLATQFAGFAFHSAKAEA